MAENNIDPEQLRQLNDALLQLTGTIRQVDSTMKKNSEEVSDTSKSLGGIIKVSPGTAKGLESVGQAAKGFYDATMQMTKAIHAGERGATVSAKAATTFAESLDTAAKTIAVAVALIPGVGIGLKLAAGAAAVY